MILATYILEEVSFIDEEVVVVLVVLASLIQFDLFVYCLFSGVDDLKPVTHLLAVNATSRIGIKLLREGIHYLVFSCHYNKCLFKLMLTTLE